MITAGRTWLEWDNLSPQKLLIIEEVATSLTLRVGFVGTLLRGTSVVKTGKGIMGSCFPWIRSDGRLGSAKEPSLC